MAESMSASQLIDDLTAVIRDAESLLRATAAQTGAAYNVTVTSQPANQTCTVKSADQVKGIDANDQVEMSCVQVAGVWTLAKVRERH